MNALRLFTHPQDAIQDAVQARRQAAQARARSQTRCGLCGRWARAEQLTYGLLCLDCTHDTRPSIQTKVKQVEAWWETRRAG